MILGRHTRRRPVTKWRLGPRDARPAAMFRRPTMVPAGRSTRSALQKIKFTGSWQDRLLRRRAPKPRDSAASSMMASHRWQSRRVPRPGYWNQRKKVYERSTTSERAPGHRPTRLSLVQRPGNLKAARRYGLGRTMQRRAMTMRKIKEGGKFTRKRRRKQRTRRRRDRHGGALTDAEVAASPAVGGIGEVITPADTSTGKWTKEEFLSRKGEPLMVRIHWLEADEAKLMTPLDVRDDGEGGWFIEFGMGEKENNTWARTSLYRPHNIKSFQVAAARGGGKKVRKRRTRKRRRKRRTKKRRRHRK